MIKQVIWNSMLDYPGEISTVIFFGGCNFDCRYCYNRELIKMKSIDFDKEILPKLLKRKECIDHVILSGGECTIANDFEEVLDKLYKLGFKIGLHTNASRADIIKKNIDKISYLGIDVKTSKEKYSDLTKNIDFDFDNVVKTIKTAIDNNKNYECRTTLCPKDVDLDDCIEIATLLKNIGIEKYMLQKYQNIGSSDNIVPYKDEYIDKICEECNKIICTKLKTR